MDFKRKLLVTVLSTSLLASSFTGFVPASFTTSSTYVSAATDNQTEVNKWADVLTVVYAGISEEERALLREARKKLNALTTEQWNRILGTTFITTVDGKIGEGKAIEIAKAIATIIYTPEADFKAAILDFRQKYAADFDTVFSRELTVDQLLGFFNELVGEQLIPAIKAGLSQKLTYQEVINNAVQSTKRVYPDFNGAFKKGTGITVAELVGGVRDRLELEMDPDKIARNTFTIGLARSINADIEGKASLVLNNETEKSGVYKFNIGPRHRDIEGVTWVSSDPTVASFEGNTLTAKKVGKTTVRAVVLGDLVIGQKEVTVSTPNTDGGTGGPGTGGPGTGSPGTGTGGNTGGGTGSAGGDVVIEDNQTPLGLPTELGEMCFGKVTYVSEILDLKVEKESDKRVVLKPDTTKLSKDANLEKISLWKVVEVSKDQTSLELVHSRYVNGEVIAKIKTSGKYVLAHNDKSFEVPTKEVYAKSSVEVLGSKCIVKGRPDGTYDYQSEISRIEYLVLLTRLLDLKATGSKKLNFSDVGSKSWYSQELLAALEAGLTTGFKDGTFKPNQKITRKEMAILTARALKIAGLAGKVEVDVILAGFKDADKLEKWAKADIALAVESGLIAGYPDGTLRPNEKANRAQAAVMTKRFFDLYLQ